MVGQGEGICNEFQELVKLRGIVHEISAAYLPKFDPVAISFSRTILDMARIMILVMDVQQKDVREEAIQAVFF